MKAALLGFPQAGKRTLFSLLTGRRVSETRKESDSIEGQAPVHDSRLDAIANVVKPRKMKYAEMTFVLCPDIKAVSDGRDWLEAARRCDLLCMVVRAFKDESVYHPSGSVDAERDRASLETELLLVDLELVEKRLERIGKEKREGQAPAQALEEKTLVKCAKAIESEKKPGDLDMEIHELESVKSLGLLTLKPVIWTYNVDENDVTDKGNGPVAIACKIEREIMDIEDAEERKEYLAELGLTSSGVDRMNRAAYDALGLISFYTVIKDEVRAWTIRKGTPAPAAAGKVHSDMERGFIRVEIIGYDDFIAAGSEALAREQGKAHLKGKDYILEDGDICTFRFNV